MRSYLYSTLASFLFLSSPPFLQADEREAFNVFADVAVGGTWHNQDTKLQHSYRRLGNHFLLMIENDTAFVIVGIDPADDTHTRWEFREDGSINISKSKEIEGRPDTTKFKLLTTSDDFQAGTVLCADYSENEITLKTEEGEVLEVWTREPLKGEFPSLASDSPNEMPKCIKLLSGKKWLQGADPDGMSFLGASVSGWILNGNFFVLTGSTIAENQETAASMFIYGKDPQTGQHKCWEFSAGDPPGAGTFSILADGMSLKGTFTAEAPFNFAGKMQLLDDGALEYTASGTMGDDPKELPYGWTYYPVK